MEQIKVEFVYNKGRIKGLKITGHTDKIVCNSISGILYYLIIGGSDHCMMDIEYRDVVGDSYLLIKGDWIKASFIDMIQTFKKYIDKLRVVYKDKIVQAETILNLGDRDVSDYIRTSTQRVPD